MRSLTTIGQAKSLARIAALTVFAAGTLALPRSTAAQMGAGMSTGAKLELTHVPVAAREAYFSGVADLANIFVPRGITRLEEALRLEPSFGLARVFWANQAPNMAIEERTTELNRGVADAAKGSAGEVALAMAMRARRLNRPEEARNLFRAARQLLPADPYVAYYATLGSIDPNATAEEQITAMRRLTEQFPDLAPAHNTLAYRLYAGGDRVGALAAVRRYAELLPNHPNAKDSYAEILQWEGRFDQALDLYRAAATIDPDYGAAYTGLAEVRQLQGRGGDARAALNEGISRAATPTARANLHRLIALSFAVDGKLKEAEGALGTAMTVATDANLSGLVSAVHRDFAQVNAMAGNGRGVASHLQATTNPNPTLMVVDAMLLAAGGMNAEARAKLDEAARDPASGQNAYVTSHAPIVRSLVLVNEGNGAAALAEIVKGDITLPIAHAVSALAEQQRKNTATARLLRDRVLSDPLFVASNRESSLARAIASRVK